MSACPSQIDCCSTVGASVFEDLEPSFSIFLPWGFFLVLVIMDQSVD